MRDVKHLLEPDESADASSCGLQDVAFVIIKPDAMRRQLSAEILTALSSKFQILHTTRHTLTVNEAKQLYPKLVGTRYEERVVMFMTSGPSLLVVLRADKSQIAMLREMVGATEPSAAEPTSLRGRLRDSTSGLPNNLLHASDSPREARREIQIFMMSLKSLDLQAVSDRSR